MRVAPGVYGALVAGALHAGAAAALVSVDVRALLHATDRTVAFEVREPTPPAPPPPPPEPPPPEPPRVAARQPRVFAPRLASTPPAPPPPHQSPPEVPPQEPPPPVFGVTFDSVVDGESEVAVPVGNTLMTKDRTPAPPGPPPMPYAAPTAPAFSPVSEDAIAEWPTVDAVKAPYPDAARRLGVEGSVRMRIGIDRRGQVRSLRVVAGVGHGLDEAAEKAMRASRFTPCRARGGDPIDCVIAYTYTFRLPDR